jgi:hypothetical protein
MRARAALGFGAIVFLSFFALSCSAFLKHEYDDLTPTEQEQHLGTQLGYHRLSPYYAVAVGGGAGNPRLMQVYFYENGTSRRHLIGTLEAVTFESADFGPRDQHFMMSADGTKLLYFHEARLAYGSLDKPDGLYLATGDGKDTLIRASGERLIQPSEVSKYLGP